MAQSKDWENAGSCHLFHYSFFFFFFFFFFKSKNSFHRIESLEFGKIVRLWNIYGYEEHIGLKSHVLSDWISQCIASGHFACLTDGTETRQFVYVNIFFSVFVHLTITCTTTFTTSNLLLFLC